ncbi:MAG: CooT family nickel-binding protein [Euryarchaeota archaeon]|nr:CooT family nickel-binding protein [Euryarchaeota archaeon]MBU4608606.1 CooT family nickel-binding protein [Euryarchaeota archaeon]MBV1729991.1 CooT family nickel-binding protein [Methanobacterium sp.]MBV1754470.1 CooT family nickel-binding protein [Methanobacterium sp.]MBV1768025.1 CooT family nickel-binding protein [Methanobacterium sp.]
MCESNAYTSDGTLIMEDVLNIKIKGKKIQLVDILNQKKMIQGTITEIDLDKHSIFIKIN